MSNIQKYENQNNEINNLSTIDFASLDIKKSEIVKLEKMSKQMLRLSSTENALSKELQALKHKISNNPDILKFKQLKTQMKNIKRANSQLNDNVTGALEVMLCDYEPELPLYQKLQKLNGGD